MFHQVRTSLSPENLREVYSYISKPFDLDEEYQRRIEQRSIILEPSNPMAKPNLMMFKFRCKNIISQHSAKLAKNKQQLRSFRNFQVQAVVDETPKVNCKQPFRTRILPELRKNDINAYKN